jgi:hypothetical protein
MKKSDLMKVGVFLLACVIVLKITLNTIVAAETTSVARIVFLHAKPGTTTQMEEGIKKHLESRQEGKDEWRWLTWEYVSGEIGLYAVATFGHAWGDYDRHKTSPFVEEALQGTVAGLCLTPPIIQYFDHLEEISASGTADETPAMVEIAVFQVHFGKTAQFYETVRQFHLALQKARSPQRYEWFELLNGGEAPQFMLFLPRRNWGAFDEQRGFLLKALEKSVGKQKADQLFAQFTAAVESSRRYAVRLRPDLSNLPSSTTQPIK